MIARGAVATAIVLLGGCATPSLVLLPDDGGGQGAVAVLEADGRPTEAVIAQGNSRTRLGSRAPVARPLGAKGLNARQAALVGGLPIAPRAFTLYFEQGGTILTAQSAAALADIRADVAARTGPEIEVTGHSDTVGSDEDNDRLSQRRAEEVVNWLGGQGFDRSIMSAVGRGEREPLQPTADNVDNAANRRVEVIVR